MVPVAADSTAPYSAPGRCRRGASRVNAMLAWVRRYEGFHGWPATLTGTELEIVVPSPSPP